MTRPDKQGADLRWQKALASLIATKATKAMIFLGILGFLLLLMIGVSYPTLEFFRTQKLEAELRFQSQQLREIEQVVQLELGFAAQQVQALTKLPAMRRFLVEASTQDRGDVETYFSQLVATKESYDQLRYIDESGQERVRIEKSASGVTAVSQDRLQNKSGRYYFTQSQMLQPGKVLMTPIDLNVERGIIERPLKPTIRFVAKLSDHQGRNRGVIVLNYRAANLLGRVRSRFESDTDVRPVLLNRDGYPIIGPNSEEEWGFMFNRPELSYQAAYPEIWSQVSAAKEVRLRHAQEVGLSYAVEPLSPTYVNETDPSASVVTDSQPSWFAIVLGHSGDIAASPYRSGDVQLAMISGASLLAVIAWLLATGIVRQRDHLLAMGQAKVIAEAANEAKSTFLASMSHEIRTPLNAIISTAYLLEKSSLDQRQLYQVRSMRTSGKGLLRVINNVLDIAKIEAGELYLDVRPFSLPSLLSQLTLSFTPQVSAKGLQFEVLPLSKDVADVYMGDKHYVYQMLVNLMGNAVKFTERGSITVSVSKLSAPDDDTHDLLRFAVRDTGEGISSESLPRLFSRFEQGDNSSKRRISGTGLGLSLVRELAQKNGR